MSNSEKVLTFGDVHLHWKAAKIILDKARTEDIRRVITLGDEAHKIYPFEAGEPMDYKRLFDELRAFRDEDPERVLTCVIGDKTAGVPQDLFRNFAGVNDEGKIESLVYSDGNIIAAHNGGYIEQEFGRFIESWDRYEPLVIFHGHSHSMGVLPQYAWLKQEELVHWLQSDEERYKLNPKSVYWVNPGGNFMQVEPGVWAANFAVYDPREQTVVLRTERYVAEGIEPTIVSDVPPPLKR